MLAVKHISLLLVLISFLVIGFSPNNAFAEEVDQEFQNWDIVTLRVDVPHRLRFYAEVQPRIGLSNSEPQYSGFERLLIRPAVGYQVTPNLSIWQGYAWAPGFRPEFINENRIFQQVLLENHIKKLSLTNRTRLEERFIERAGGTSVRARHMIRASYPILRSQKWSLVGYDEFFVNLNDTDFGLQAGFDQNRVFAGLNRKFNDYANAEIGYLINYVDRKNASDKINNILLVGLNFIVK